MEVGHDAPVRVDEYPEAILLRFERAEIRNPLSGGVIDLLHEVLSSTPSNSGRKIIFTGSDSVFASGADLNEIAGLTKETARGFSERGQALIKLIEDLHSPTIAAISGYCFGGGLDLALACKRRFASRNAKFCHPGASLGIITGWGGTQRLPRLIGEAKAMEMFLTAKPIDATEALRIGLIDSIVEDPLYHALNF